MRCKKLCNNRAAPSSSTTAKAISLTTSVERRRPLSSPPVPRPLLFRESVRLTLEACKAGARPNKIPANNETRKAKPRSRPSRPIVSSRGIAAGMILTRKRNDNDANASPSPPPSSPNTRLSASNWQVTRPRLAPRAIRTAISLRRPLARVNKRFAMLAQTIKSTHPTPPKRTSNGVRRSPVRNTSSGTRRTVRGLFSGCSLFSALAMVTNSAWACWSVTSGFSRPTTSR